MSGIGGIFHAYAKGVKKTPYLAKNFQRNLVKGLGLIHECSTLDAQNAFLEVMLGQDKVDVIASTGGDGTLSRVTTAARKVLESHNSHENTRTIDDILFHHNRAGTQNVLSGHYGLPFFWQLGFAAMVHNYHLFSEEKAPPLDTHVLPQLQVSTTYLRDSISYDSVEYGSMFIGAALNKFLQAHYDVSDLFEKFSIPHYLADLSIIARGAFQPSYSRPFLSPVRGRILVDGHHLPLDRFNFLLVFSNDWDIDLKLTNLSPCRALRLPENKGKLQVVAGDADMPAAVYTVFRQAFGLDWKVGSIHSAVGDEVVIHTDEKQYNLDGDFYPCSQKVVLRSGFHVNLVKDYSEKYLSDVFSGDRVLFEKFLHDFSQR